MNLSFADTGALLPEHISGDPKFATTGEALKPILNGISLAIPNLLIYSRLGGQKPESFLAPLIRLTKAGGGLKSLSLEALESLAWQFHVDFREVAGEDKIALAKMVLNSIAWHRIKGTKKSLEAAFSLFNYGGISIREHEPNLPWAAYELGFDNIPSLDDLTLILQIAYEMQPARCRLWRVYTSNYDYRPGIWSGKQPDNAWSVFWWSGYSGTYFPDLPGLDQRGLMVSFALKTILQSEAWAKTDSAYINQTACLLSFLPLSDWPIWSRFYYSQPCKPRLPFAISEIMPLHACQLFFWPELQWYDAPWQNQKWAQIQFWDREREPFSINHTDLPYSQMVWSDSLGNGESKAQMTWLDTIWPDQPWQNKDYGKAKRGWSGENSFYGFREILITAKSPNWGEFKWSDPQPEPVYKRIDQFFYENLAIASDSLEPAKSGFLASEACSCNAYNWPPENWPNAKWQEDTFCLASEAACCLADCLLTNRWPDINWPAQKWHEPEPQLFSALTSILATEQ